MRPEQVTRLVALEEELIDVFDAECKPKEWPTMDDAKQRGDRYWYKKNALATLTLAGRIQTVLRDARTDGGTEKPGDGKTEPRSGEEREDIAQEAARLEKQGVALLRTHAKRRG